MSYEISTFLAPVGPLFFEKLANLSSMKGVLFAFEHLACPLRTFNGIIQLEWKHKLLMAHSICMCCCVVSNILDGHALWLIEFPKSHSQSFVTVMIYTSEVHTFYSLHLGNILKYNLSLPVNFSILL